jgi:hypothetical protein
MLKGRAFEKLILLSHSLFVVRFSKNCSSKMIDCRVRQRKYRIPKIIKILNKILISNYIIKENKKKILY